MLIYLVLFGSPLIMLTLPWLLCFKAKSGKSDRVGPPKGGYKPGHLPEFVDPDQKECNTFYDVNSLQAFPPKEELPTPATTPAKQSTNVNNNEAPVVAATGAASPATNNPKEPSKPS